MNLPLNLSDALKNSTAIRTKYLSPRNRIMTAAADSEFRKVERKYKKFERHEAIYESAVGAFMSIGRALNSRELALSQENDTTKAFFTNPVQTMLRDIVQPSNPRSRYIAVEKAYVETKLATKDVEFKLNYGNPERLAQAEKILKQYFPTFSLPKTFKGADPAAAGSFGRFVVGANVSSTLSVETLSTIVPVFNAPGNVKGNTEDFRFKLPKGYREANFGKIAYVEATIHLEAAELRDEYMMIVRPSAEGSLLGGRYDLKVKVSFNLVFRWPWEFALYATCAETREKFIPFLFYQYVNWHRIAYAGNRTRGGGLSIKPPRRVNHLGNILDLIEAEKKAGRIVIPRVNEDNFTIMGTGEPSMMGKVIWIDTSANKVQDYMTQIRSAFNTEEKAIDLSKLKIHGTSLFADFHNEKFVYVREAGSDNSASDISGIKTLDLTGSLALDSTTIAINLNKRLSDNPSDVKDLMVICYKALAGEYPELRFSKPYSPDFIQSFGFSEFDARKGRNLFTEMGQLIVESPDINVTWASFGGRKLAMRNPDGEDFVEDSEQGSKFERMRQIRSFCGLLVNMCEELLRNFDKLTFAYSAKVETWRFMFVLITKYAKNHEEFQRVLDEATVKNEATPYTKEDVLNVEGKLNIANLPGLTDFIPAQVETIYDLQKQPKMALLDLVVGFGKGLMGPVDICNLLQKKEIKRPLAMVPGHLVKNWANEIQKYSKGQINTIILTIQTLRRLQQVYRGDTNPASKPSYVFMKQIIEACPPNTIFITNFRFLSIDKEEIVYANSIITRYYSAEFLREMRFDWVGIDESHGIKNIASNQTKGASIVTSVAEFKRLLSGTLVNNTIADLVGQVGIGNPAALGNTSTFIARYGSSYTGEDGESTTGEWRPDAASLIVKDMKPYAKKITHKRKRIAFMLPEAVENFYQVEMTPIQKQFYDGLLKRSFEELREKNPKLFAKMLDGNEKDEGALLVGLSTHFQAVEQFLCAPDSVPEFMDLDGLTEADTISPKIPKIVELLDNHFARTLDNSGLGEVEEGSKYKVIIFGNRKVSSAHVMKHLPEKYKKMAVHYTADNKQAGEIFERNDKIRILVADGASITSGLNLQYADMMIRLETVWAPGDLEQAFARIWRPAFGTSRGFDRKKVFLAWLICNNSLDVAKIGRIISKLVEKTKLDLQEDLSFTFNTFKPSQGYLNLKIGDQPMIDFIPEAKLAIPIEKMLSPLPLIKMNNETLLELQEMGQLAAYFATYALVNDYEIQEFNKEKKEGLQQLIRIPESARTTIEGSKTLAYKPRVPGSNPDVYDPNGYFGYKPISVIESDIAINELEDDDENEKYVEVNPVVGGELVDTEFGIGYISGILQNEVWVDIKGRGSIRVPKATAWLITNPIAVKGITKTLETKTIIRNPPGIPTSSTDVYDYQIFAPDSSNSGSSLIQNNVEDADVVVKPKVIAPLKDKQKIQVQFKPDAKPPMPNKEQKLAAPVVKEKAYDKYDTEEEDDVENSIDIYAEIIDGQIALTTSVEDNDSDMLVQDFDFKLIDKYVAIQVKTEDALDKLFETLRSKFTIKENYIQNFDVYKALLASKKLKVATPADFRDTQLFFQEAKKSLKEGFLRPFPIVWGDSLFVGIDYNRTPSIRAATLLVRKANIPNVKIQPTQEGVHVKFFKTAEEAISEITEIANNIEVPNLEDTISYLKGIKRKSIPVAPKAPTVNPARPKTQVQFKKLKEEVKPPEPTKRFMFRKK